MSSPSPKLAGFERNVLLIDAVEARQLARAAALRHAGATVQSVSTGEAARALWKPGSYQLVMIELEGAGPDARQFYDYARAMSERQAFAFYIDRPPYLSDAPGEPPRVARKRPASGSRRPQWRISLSEASEQIALAHASARRQPGGPQASASRPTFAEAVRAAEDEAAGKASQ